MWYLHPFQQCTHTCNFITFAVLYANAHSCLCRSFLSVQILRLRQNKETSTDPGIELQNRMKAMQETILRLNEANQRLSDENKKLHERGLTTGNGHSVRSDPESSSSTGNVHGDKTGKGKKPKVELFLKQLKNHIFTDHITKICNCSLILEMHQKSWKADSARYCKLYWSVQRIILCYIALCSRQYICHVQHCTLCSTVRCTAYITHCTVYTVQHTSLYSV